jgi:hypothetical protein
MYHAALTISKSAFYIYGLFVILGVWLRTGRPADRGSIPGAGRDDFSSSLCPDRFWVLPASCTMGTGGRFPGGKARPGRDAEHSSPSSAEVVNE